MRLLLFIIAVTGTLMATVTAAPPRSIPSSRSKPLPPPNFPTLTDIGPDKPPVDLSEFTKSRQSSLDIEWRKIRAKVVTVPAFPLGFQTQRTDDYHDADV